MKKLLMGVFGLGLMLSFVTVKAETIDNVEEDTNYTSADVTVWNVETPVYNVEIEWEDLSFNWEFDEISGEYGWTRNACVPLSEEVKNSITEANYKSYVTRISTDKNCSTGNSLQAQNITYEVASQNLDNYYMISYNSVHFDYHRISIVDKSENARITPSIEWTSTENYDWTIGEFYELIEPSCVEVTEEEFSDLDYNMMYTDSSCQTKLEDENATWADDSYYKYGNISFEKITTKEIPDSLRNENNYYDIHFKLGIDKTKTIKTPEIGDKIGTVTISIK